MTLFIPPQPLILLPQTPYHPLIPPIHFLQLQYPPPLHLHLRLKLSHPILHLPHCRITHNIISFGCFGHGISRLSVSILGVLSLKQHLIVELVGPLPEFKELLLLVGCEEYVGLQLVAAEVAVEDAVGYLLFHSVGGLQEVLF
jgi:hypothetical protein